MIQRNAYIVGRLNMKGLGILCSLYNEYEYPTYILTYIRNYSKYIRKYSKNIMNIIDFK